MHYPTSLVVLLSLYVHSLLHSHVSSFPLRLSSENTGYVS